ncbi:MAG: hypothetical protein IIZ59_03645 [Clostridia bacterium]|nr:hypothetical protein [Clostridia bacterium]
MSKIEYSVEIFNAIAAYLNEEELECSADSEKGVFRIALDQRGIIRKIFIRIGVHSNNFVVYAYLPIGGTADDRKMMAQLGEFFHRANYGLLNGNFDFDYRDGEIRYKTFVDCADIVPSPAVIKNSLDCTEAMLHYYTPGVVDIIFGHANAKDAIELCEKSFSQLLEEYGEFMTDDDDDDDDEIKFEDIFGPFSENEEDDDEDEEEEEE